MSAFQVTSKHIATLVGIAQELTNKGLTYLSLDGARPFEDEKVVFAHLARENALSVNYRYSDNEEPVAFERVPVVKLDTLEQVVAAVKALDCYEYQSCEHPEWETSKVYRWCISVRVGLFQQVPGFRRAYEKAPWSVY